MQKVFRKILLFTGLNDKVLHAIFGLIVASLAGIVIKDPWVCFGIAFVVGLAKEIYDLYSNGDNNWYDWFATMGGGLVYVILFNLFS